MPAQKEQRAAASRLQIGSEIAALDQAILARRCGQNVRGLALMIAAGYLKVRIYTRR
jgi:hypothetical protein